MSDEDAYSGLGRIIAREAIAGAAMMQMRTTADAPTASNRNESNRKRKQGDERVSRNALTRSLESYF